MQNRVAERVQKYRTNQRDAGLRAVQFWVQDTRQAGFAEECARQSALVQNDPQEAEILTWLDAAADRSSWQ